MVWILVIAVIVLVIVFMNKESNKMDDAEKYFNLGLSQFEIGEYDKAIESYTKTIALYPNYYAAYNNRGITKMEMGNLQAALKDFEESITIEPDKSKNIKAFNNKQTALDKIEILKNKSKDKNYQDLIQKGNNLYFEANFIDSILYFKKALEIKTTIESFYDVEHTDTRVLEIDELETTDHAEKVYDFCQRHLEWLLEHRAFTYDKGENFISPG
jgi:tetratricopeptide (TPR) repeat protein